MSSGSLNSLLGSSFGQPGAPGFVPPAATAAIGQGAGQSIAAMANRYNQLGMGGPGMGGGTQTPMGTPEAMDLGLAPSITGGIPAQFAAVGGQLQNQAVLSPALGKNTSPASILGNIGGFLNR